MNEILALFSAFFVVAIIPGPLAIVAFYGGTRGLTPFLTGLMGQLLGLIIITNIIATLGASSGFNKQPWFLSVAAVALVWLGFRIITADKKGKPADRLTFASTFMMAASNPKAILGFGPPLLFFHRDGITSLALLLSSAVLIAAVSLAMIFYFGLGSFVKDRSIVRYIRLGAGFLLAGFGLLILFAELYVHS